MLQVQNILECSYFAHIPPLPPEQQNHYLKYRQRHSSSTILQVYRMWDFQYSRIRMRILHFNIRAHRMQMRM